MSDQSYRVEVENDIDAPALPTQRLVTAIVWVLEKHGAPPGAGVTVVITDDEQVREMNRTYRGVDAATDVLSFPSDPLPEPLRAEMLAAGEESVLYLGDLIVAYPYTAQHAQAAGHALDDEMVLLAVHGTLHLLGFDHDNAERQRAMWAAQHAALDALGVALRVPDFTFDDATHHDPRAEDGDYGR